MPYQPIFDLGCHQGHFWNSQHWHFHRHSQPQAAKSSEMFHCPFPCQHSWKLFESVQKKNQKKKKQKIKMELHQECRFEKFIQKVINNIQQCQGCKVRNFSKRNLLLMQLDHQIFIIAKKSSKYVRHPICVFQPVKELKPFETLVTQLLCKQVHFKGLKGTQTQPSSLADMTGMFCVENSHKHIVPFGRYPSAVSGRFQYVYLWCHSANSTWNLLTFSFFSHIFMVEC